MFVTPTDASAVRVANRTVAVLFLIAFDANTLGVILGSAPALKNEYVLTRRGCGSVAGCVRPSMRRAARARHRSILGSR